MIRRTSLCYARTIDDRIVDEKVKTFEGEGGSQKEAAVEALNRALCFADPHSILWAMVERMSMSHRALEAPGTVLTVEVQ